MPQGKKIYMSAILTLDPSGTTETGYFLFRSSQEWEFGTLEGKNAVEQGKNLNLLVKNKKPSYLAWETSNFLKIKHANADLLELIYFNGIIPYISAVNYIEKSQKIFSSEVVRFLNSGDITGLELRLIKGERGRPKQFWFFKDKEITIHQRDALAVFYVCWVVKLKRPWPFI